MIISLGRRQVFGIKAYTPFLSKTFSVQSAKKTGINKALLTDLRKKTGYSFAKCNQALKLYDNNMDNAERWLHEQAEKEGWSKAEKLKQRSTQQGQVGVLVEENFATVVELACETDFVARNELFQELVSLTAKSTLQFRKEIILQNQQINSLAGDDDIAHLRELLLTHEMQTLKVPGSTSTLEEHLVGVVGKLGENIKLKRAIAIATGKHNIIGTAVHGNSTSTLQNCLMGSYVSAVVLKPLSNDFNTDKAMVLAKGISQHVIGMNPKSISPQEGIDEEDALLTQDYLLNDKQKVGQLLRDVNVECIDFIRYGVNQ